MPFLQPPPLINYAKQLPPFSFNNTITISTPDPINLDCFAWTVDILNNANNFMCHIYKQPLSLSFCNLFWSMQDILQVLNNF